MHDLKQVIEEKSVDLREPAVKNIQSFIGLLKEDLWNSPDYYERELGSLTDLPDELESLDFDISRGLYNNLMNRFEEIFFIAEGYKVSWRSYKELFYDHLVKDIQILDAQNTGVIEGFNMSDTLSHECTG